MKKSSILLFAAAVLAMTAGVCRVEGSVLRGTGDFEFFADISSQPTIEGKTLTLIQVAIPTKEIKYEEKGGAYRSELRISVSLRDETGEFAFQQGYTLKDEKAEKPVATDISGFFYVTDSTAVDPDGYLLDIKIEDLNRRKKTLIGLIKKRYFVSELKDVEIEVKAYPSDRLALGDPILIWSLDHAKRYAPNPMRIYGLRRDTLSVYVGAVLPAAADEDSIFFAADIVGEGGEVVDSLETRVPIEGGRASFLGIFDVNMYPAGGYRLNVTAVDERGSVSRSGKDFSVAWELVNWQKPQRDLLVEARILLADEEFRAFQNVSLGEQEKILGEYWKQLDPTPQTARNETFEKFFARLAYADRYYGESVRGALTDRGQVFIRFGPPSDIETQTVPVNRQDIWRALSKLEDQYDIMLHTVIDERTGIVKDIRMHPSATQDSKAYRGASGMDAGAYELWIYDQRGDPLLERDRAMSIYTGLRFLFIDLDGIGRYELIGTSEELRSDYEQ